MLPQQTTVLVVGAGPVGLTTAASLVCHGCKDLIIVDAVERNKRPLSSRALGVHAATLEVSKVIVSLVLNPIIEFQMHRPLTLSTLQKNSSHTGPKGPV